MSAAIFDSPIRLIPGTDTRPGLARLVQVELRKMIDTRAGFWLQVAIVALTLVVVVVRSILGDASDHTFVSILDVALGPAAFLLPVAGILLVTSEWSQRTGMITFALVPVRSRVIGAKLLASVVVAVTALAVIVAIAAGAAFVAGVDATWTHVVALIGQSAVFLVAGMVKGIAFGMIALSSAPAIVAFFALPTGWAALASLPVLAGVAPWLDTNRALGSLSKELLSGTQWAQVATSLAVWMLLPLLIGAWRITRRETAS
jgi:ABC-type transport system involved in multi-copper enzyme maturation permease subunit